MMSEIAALLNPVEIAVAIGNLEMLKVSLEGQSYNPKQNGYNGRTLLHCACLSGHLDIVKYLIDVHQLDLLSEDDSCKTPLHLACEHSHLDIVRYLVNDQKVDPAYASGDQSACLTPLHSACGTGHLEIVKFLVEEKGCDYTQAFQTEEGYVVNALHLASMYGNLDVARYLIEEKQCDPMSKTENNHTPLSLACQQGHSDLVKYLANERSIDPVYELTDGSTTLHLACKNGHLETVKFLTEEKGCNPTEFNEKKRCTPYAAACYYGHLDVIRYLTEERHCDPLCKDADGFNALDIAAVSGSVNIWKYFIEERGYDNKVTFAAVQMQNIDSSSIGASGANQRNRKERDASPVPDKTQTKRKKQESEAPLPTVPPSGPPQQLNLDDLPFLMNHLQPMASHWRPFGLQLGLLSGDLDTIAATPLHIPGGPAAYLEAVLTRWMNRAPPLPTLSKLCGALRSRAVDQSRIALELEQDYQTQRKAERWDEDPQLKLLVRKAEPTGRQLGVGAYGSVEQVSIEGEMYAAKKLTMKICMNPNEFYRKFFSEFRILSSLYHPNIVQYQCVCPLPNSESPALVMEQMQTNLHDYLLNPSYANLSLNAKVSILQDVARGLAYLHNHRPAVIHRDLTARNVLLNSDRVAKISDFGNSRIIDVDPACSTHFQSTTHVPGTTIYMPPEACSDHAKFNEKLDIFSFGHLALFTATQVFPCELLPVTFYDDDGKLCARTEVERRQKYIDQLEQQLGGNHDLIKLIKQCLHNNFRMRPTADEIISVLEQVLTTSQ